MGLFNFKKKEILQDKPIDEINNEELKQNIKKIATEIVPNNFLIFKKCEFLAEIKECNNEQVL